jgi:predicted nucleic-acid-binding protein
MRRRRLIDAAADRDQFVINTAVLCELTWFSEPRTAIHEDIAGALEQICHRPPEVERLDDARQALGDFRSTKADFSDALMGRINRSLGAPLTITFDRSLKAVETFRLL